MTRSLRSSSLKLEIEPVNLSIPTLRIGTKNVRVNTKPIISSTLVSSIGLKTLGAKKKSTNINNVANINGCSTNEMNSAPFLVTTTLFLSGLRGYLIAHGTWPQSAGQCCILLLLGVSPAYHRKVA